VNATAVMRRARELARRQGMAWWLRPSGGDLVRLGTPYGGWWVPRAAVRPGAIAYCAGAGEDISFDLALFEAGCAVRVIDPTPRAIAYVHEHAPADARFLFLPVGLWDAADTLSFYLPSDEAFVSHSAVNLFKTGVGFQAEVKPVDQLMAEVGDDHIDILKLDIEGAEHRVMQSLLDRGPLPGVLCVEFDQPQPLRQVADRVRVLRGRGYRLVKVEQWNYTFVRQVS
jgi:FkbM family methyltransferase